VTVVGRTSMIFNGAILGGGGNQIARASLSPACLADVRFFAYQ
jgi:hypothetical protein